MEHNQLEVDVLIAGGGLVGGTLAVGLVEGGLSVAVVDMLDPLAGIDAGFDGRAAAIALSSKRVLEGLGLWDMMQPDPSPIKEIRVSDADSFFFMHYDRRDVGAEAFGYMVENRSFRKSLRTRFKELRNFTLLAPNTISNIERGHGKVLATLANGHKVTA